MLGIQSGQGLSFASTTPVVGCRSLSHLPAIILSCRDRVMAPRRGLLHQSSQLLMSFMLLFRPRLPNHSPLPDLLSHLRQLETGGRVCECVFIPEVRACPQIPGVPTRCEPTPEQRGLASWSIAKGRPAWPQHSKPCGSLPSGERSFPDAHQVLVCLCQHPWTFLLSLL